MPKDDSIDTVIHRVARDVNGIQSDVFNSNVTTMDVSAPPEMNLESSGTPGVVVQVHTQEQGSKVKNRKLACLYCGLVIFQVQRHMTRRRSDEHDVAQALASAKKQLLLQHLMRQGIYKHNIEVLRKNDGILIVSRAPVTARKAGDYLPCQFCLQFFVKRELYRHCKIAIFALPMCFI